MLAASFKKDFTCGFPTLYEAVIECLAHLWPVSFYSHIKVPEPTGMGRQVPCWGGGQGPRKGGAPWEVPFSAKARAGVLSSPGPPGSEGGGSYLDKARPCLPRCGCRSAKGMPAYSHLLLRHVHLQESSLASRGGQHPALALRPAPCESPSVVSSHHLPLQAAKGVMSRAGVWGIFFSQGRK